MDFKFAHRRRKFRLLEKSHKKGSERSLNDKSLHWEISTRWVLELSKEQVSSGKDHTVGDDSIMRQHFQ